MPQVKQGKVVVDGKTKRFVSGEHFFEDRGVAVVRLEVDEGAQELKVFRFRKGSSSQFRHQQHIDYSRKDLTPLERSELEQMDRAREKPQGQVSP